MKSVAMALFAVFLWAVTGPDRAESRDIVRIACYEIMPFASESFPEGGVATRVVRKIFSEQGIDVEISWYSMKRAFFNVENGISDMSLGWLKRPDREKVVIFSEKPLIDSPILFFFRKGEVIDWNGLDDFNEKRIGAVIGTIAYGREFLDAEESGRINVERVATCEQNIKKLLAGRIDVMIGTSIETRGALQTQFTPREREMIVAHPRPVAIQQFYAIYNKRLSPKIIKTFDDGYNRLRDSGQLVEAIREAFNR